MKRLDVLEKHFCETGILILLNTVFFIHNFAFYNTVFGNFFLENLIDTCVL